MLSFHDVVLGLLLEFLGLLVPLLLVGSLLLVVSDQFQLFLVICLTAESCARQPSPVVHCRLALQEEIHVFIAKGVHFLILLHEAQSGEELCGAVETHDFGFDCVVGGFYASKFLLEGIADDAESRNLYFAISLQRMLSP